MNNYEYYTKYLIKVLFVSVGTMFIRFAHLDCEGWGFLIGWVLMWTGIALWQRTVFFFGDK